MNIEAIKTKTEQDSDFLVKLCESETEDEIVQLCSSNNLAITLEEAKDLLTGFNKAKKAELSEEILSEDDLDKVAGGFAITATTIVLFAIGIYAAYSAGKKLGEWASKKRCKR